MRLQLFKLRKALRYSILFWIGRRPHPFPVPLSMGAGPNTWRAHYPAAFAIVWIAHLTRYPRTWRSAWHPDHRPRVRRA